MARTNKLTIDRTPRLRLYTISYCTFVPDSDVRHGGGGGNTIEEQRRTRSLEKNTVLAFSNFNKYM